MAYADYEFYKTKYFGNVVPESNEFNRYSHLASLEIDSITNKRLRKWFPEDEDQQDDIRTAVCVLAEAMYRMEQLINSGMDGVGTVSQADGTVRGKVVTSVSSGSESIGYSASGSSASSIAGLAVVKSVDIGAIICEIKSKYLSIPYKDTGYSILFAGIGYE